MKLKTDWVGQNQAGINAVNKAHESYILTHSKREPLIALDFPHGRERKTERVSADPDA